MLVNLIFLMTKNILRLEFPTKFAWIGYVLSSFLTLFILHFTSKAIGTDFFGLEQNYFTFMVVGEVSLHLVSTLLYQSATVVRSWYERGVFSYLLTTPVPLIKVISVFLMARIPRSFFFSLFQILLAKFLFSLQLDLLQIVTVLLFPLIAIILFIALGLLIISLIMFTGRGQSILFYFFNVLTILSGAYFPLTLFSESWHKILQFNPYGLVLEPIRHYLVSGSLTELWSSAIQLIVIGAIVMFVSVIAFNQAVKQLKKNDRPFTYI